MSEVGEKEKIPIVIVGIFLISIFFLFRGCEDMAGTPDLVEIPGDIFNATIKDNKSESEEHNDGEEVIEEEPLPEFNMCEAAPYGLPSFEGTSRECEGCVLDSDCLLYPPAGYVGTIIIQEMYSSPVLLCCVADGSCYW